MKKKQLEQLVLDSKDDKQKLNDLVEAYKMNSSKSRLID